MSFFRKASLTVLALAAFASSCPQFAKAEGFALQDWSARGAALAGGLVARGGDVSAVAYNPAAITELEGTQIMVGGELINLTNSINDQYGKERGITKQQWFVAPHAYVAHKLNDKVSLGLGAYSRYGLGLDYGDSWGTPVGAFGGATPQSLSLQSVELITFSVVPVIAYQVTDQLSLAAGIEIMGGICELNTGNSGIGYGNVMGLEGDALGYGLHLAAHYKFNEQWKAGLVYRSHVTLDFDGDIDGQAAFLHSPTGNAKIYTPDTYAFALAYSPMENLSFEGQVQYNTWRRFHSLTIEGDNGHSTYIPKDWRDTWFFSLSAEYDWNEWLTLRAGVSHETRSVNLQYADFMVPSNGRWKYCTGFGIHKDNWALDFSYVFHDIKSINYDQSLAAISLGAAATQVNRWAKNSTKGYANTFGISFTYKF